MLLRLQTRLLARLLLPIACYRSLAESPGQEVQGPGSSTVRGLPRRTRLLRSLRPRPPRYRDPPRRRQGQPTRRAFHLESRDLRRGRLPRPLRSPPRTGPSHLRGRSNIGVSNDQDADGEFRCGTGAGPKSPPKQQLSPDLLRTTRPALEPHAGPGRSRGSPRWTGRRSNRSRPRTSAPAHR